MYGLGALRDVDDDRDFNARLLLPPKPVALKLPFRVAKKIKKYDQDGTPKCVAFGDAGIKSDQEYRQSGRLLTFDPDWLYAECKKIDGIPNKAGTYPRVALKIMSKQMKLLGKPPSEEWKIGSYYRIAANESIDNVLQIMWLYGSVSFACGWTASWCNDMRFSKVFKKSSGGLLGGHHTRIIGANSIGLEICNSWPLSSLWGWWGIATMPYEMFEKALAEGDTWKVVDS